MTDRYWICVYSDPTEGIRGVAGAGSGEATNDLPLLIAEEDLFCEVFNPELEPGLWILAGSVGVRHRHKEEPDLDYREDESSPAPTWRRLTGPELDVISKGEAPPEMTKWLAGEAWAETAGTSIADEMRRVAERLQTAEFYDDMPISEAADLLRGGGGEAGGMTTQPIARLDRTQPPPGYTLTPSCGVWVADKRGDLIREADSFDDEADARAAAWDHYEREHDPPGMVVWLDALAGDDVWWWGDEDRNYGPQEREEADARAAAWVYYWRRVAVANDLDNLSIRDFAGTPRGCVTRWPECLVWLDEQVFTVERWISNGGDTPEVLCA